MRIAVILLWTGCLWSVVRSVLCFLLLYGPWRQLTVLAVLALAASTCHRPGTARRFKFRSSP